MTKILVIDDDPGFRRMIELTLTRAGHQVVLAKDGFEGVERFTADLPDLVVCDIVMPNKEGIETIRDLRGIAPAIPIIAMSGGGVVAGRQYLAAAQKLGADSILSKPFRPSELVEMVTQMLKAVPDSTND